MGNEQVAGQDPVALERHFEALVNADTRQREARLAELAQQKPALARRLAALLDAHERGLAGIDQFGVTVRNSLGLFDADDLLGRELGGWTLTGLLGRGGMGIVFAAEREHEGVVQRAAVKLLSIPLFDTQAGERFRREARVLARLDHPDICRLRDFGRSPEGWPYLVLDRIDGVALHLYAERCSIPERLQLVARVADAVAAAHRQLVVHLDIKPENVLVMPDGTPVLLDFGISRVLGEEDDRSASATVTRWMTPDYAAPERLRGEPSGVAADLYSLGALLYRVLTGARPFELAGLSLTDVLARIEKGIEPPSRRVAQLPRDLDAVLRKAMHPDPTRRYASAGEFADDLRAVVQRRPVKARPDSVGYRLRKLLQRHPVALPGAVLGAVAVTVMAATLAWQAGDLREQRDRAEREAARARSASNLLLGSIRAANPLVGEGGQLTVAELLDATTQRATDELADDPALLSETLIHIGDARRGLGQHALGLPLYEQALQLLDQDADHDIAALDRLRLAAVLGQVEALRATEQVEAALERARSARAGIRTAASRGRLNTVLARAHLGLGQHGEAEPLLREALLLIPETETVDWARAAGDLAFVHMARGEYEQTLHWLDRARRDLGEAPAERALLASILGNSSYALAKLGRIDEGVAQGEQGLAMRIQSYGEHHVSTVVAMLDQAYVLDVAGRWDDAAQLLRRAIAIEAALGDGNTRRMESLHRLLGDVLRRSGRPQEALEPMRESVRIASVLYPQDSYQRALPHGNFAGVLADLGECESALEHSRIARALYEKGGSGGARRGAAITASNLADCHLRLGQLDDALHWADTALREGADLPDAQTGYLARIQLVRAAALKQAGRLHEALEQVQEAGRGLDAAPSVMPLQSRRTRFTLLAELHEALGDAGAAAQARAALEALEADDG